MSAGSKMFALGGVCVAGLFILGNALHWFMTPMAHPAASRERMVAVGVQAVVGLVLSAYGYIRARRESAEYSSGTDIH